MSHLLTILKYTVERVPVRVKLSPVSQVKPSGYVHLNLESDGRPIHYEPFIGLDRIEVKGVEIFLLLWSLPTLLLIFLNSDTDCVTDRVSFTDNLQTGEKESGVTVLST